MSGKIFFVLFVLNVLGGTIASNVQSRHVRSTSTSSSNITRSTLDTLITQVNSFADEINEVINTVNAEIANITAELTTTVTDKTVEILENVNTAIGNVVGENGTDSAVYECANAQLNETEQVIADIISDLASCIESSIEDVTSCVTDLTTIVEDTTALLEAIETGSATCEATTSVISQALCWSELAVTSAATFVTIEAEGLALITTVTSLQATVPAYLQSCLATALAKAAVSETEIMVAIGVCAATSTTSS